MSSASCAISDQLLDTAGEALLGLLDLDDEAALGRAARLALDLRAQRRLALVEVRDGLREVAQRERAGGDARLGTALEEVLAVERVAAALLLLDRERAEAHL